MPVDIKEQWRRFAEVWMTGNLEALDAILSPQVVYHLPPFQDMDRTALKQFILEFRKSFPDFHVTTDEDVIEGNTSAHRWHCTATYAGESLIFSVAPTGKQTSAIGSHICHWADDKMIEVWHNGDWLGWLENAGVIAAME
jgi:hypothetical protein